MVVELLMTLTNVFFVLLLVSGLQTAYYNLASNFMKGTYPADALDLCMMAFLPTCATIPAKQTTIPTELCGERRVWFRARLTDTVTISLLTPMMARVRLEPMVMIRYSNT